jgi:hypothetical protein
MAVDATAKVASFPGNQSRRMREKLGPLGHDIFSELSEGSRNRLCHPITTLVVRANGAAATISAAAAPCFLDASGGQIIFL